MSCFLLKDIPGGRKEIEKNRKNRKKHKIGVVFRRSQSWVVLPHGSLYGSSDAFYSNWSFWFIFTLFFFFPFSGEREREFYFTSVNFA